MVHITTRIGAALALTASLAALPAGCGSNVDVSTGGAGGTGGDGGNSGCPATAPSLGTSCTTLETCKYGPTDCPAVFTCENNAWSAAPAPCPPSCPADVPANGAACNVEGAVCNYPDPSCGDAGADATCDGGHWSISQYGPGCIPYCPSEIPVEGQSCSGCCLPPSCPYFDPNGCVVDVSCNAGVWTFGEPACPPPSACAKHTTSAACVQDAACRWLVEGCGGIPQPFPPGCYPAADCQSDADCASGTCKEITFDPCWNGDCNVCSSNAKVCLP